MLAPRKKLWSTPSEILHVVCNWIELTSGDKVCDIGCGDGRVLIHMAAHWTTSIEQKRVGSDTDNEDEYNALLSSVSFVGLDINQDRIEEASVALKAAKETGLVHPDLSVEFHCENAMEAKYLYESATIFFLYLIPRGLKIFKPLLLEVLRDRIEIERADSTSEHHNSREKLTIFTYMSPLPGEKFAKRELCEVAHQPGTAWPVFLYHLTETACTPGQEQQPT